MRRRGGLGLPVGVTAAMAVFLAFSAVAQAATPPRVLPPIARPFGATYGEWSARWWQWVASVPADHNPVVDPTGADCGRGQPGGRVWFLAGTFGGSVTRRCTVPVGRALFFPVANVICLATEPGETAAEQHDCARELVDGVTGLAAEVDGLPVPFAREASPTFPVVLGAGNLFGLPPGTYPFGAADGYYVMLAPPHPGSYTVHFTEVFPDVGVIEATYHLDVSAFR